ncbi:hypothetical protein NSS60_04600 [Anoxybacillus sp. FSL W8-0382]|uniref:Uncharacterized protein n=2 Tax=Anoxybacillus flavithermus TaxID=33934 RepID=A0AAX1ZWR0_9BACL|nr:hypothetical protein [Anoxybacillus flavithermus]MBE2909030.1 hypothetical protein [Anoxybacillus flavithermus]MBE2914558.1 hypothetical protein [Anoxybacillus flavithermus]MBE2935427.1 hypothetical protein [Anoxybacillus flavithermus]OAO76795.1 hypothetical protein A0O32_2711 [Anoxybacillus flavithermus]RWU07845.1 hypothetical protein EA138_13555 [Anoxybacillus flavithermus]
MKITREMIEKSYDYAKEVYHKKIDKTSAANSLYREIGMHQGSAYHYIEAFCSMMQGKKYTRTINTEATRYYLENIHKDYGVDQLRIALKAVEQHTDYYGKLGRGNLRSIEKLVNEYKTQLGKMS